MLQILHSVEQIDGDFGQVVVTEIDDFGLVELLHCARLNGRQCVFAQINVAQIGRVVREVLGDVRDFVAG